MVVRTMIKTQAEYISQPLSDGWRELAATIIMGAIDDFENSHEQSVEKRRAKDFLFNPDNDAFETSAGLLLYNAEYLRAGLRKKYGIQKKGEHV